MTRATDALVRNTTPRAVHSAAIACVIAPIPQRVTPLPRLAVHLAEHMMQQHIRGSRRIGAREIADDRVESEDCLDGLAREPAIENVAGAFGEEVDEIAALGQRQCAQLAAGLHEIEQRRDILYGAGPDIRRRYTQHVAQHRGDAIEHRVIGGQRLRIAP